MPGFIDSLKVITSNPDAMQSIGLALMSHNSPEQMREALQFGENLAEKRRQDVEEEHARGFLSEIAAGNQDYQALGQKYPRVPQAIWSAVAGKILEEQLAGGKYADEAAGYSGFLEAMKGTPAQTRTLPGEGVLLPEPQEAPGFLEALTRPPAPVTPDSIGADAADDPTAAILSGARAQTVVPSRPDLNYDQVTPAMVPGLNPRQYSLGRKLAQETATTNSQIATREQSLTNQELRLELQGLRTVMADEVARGRLALDQEKFKALQDQITALTEELKRRGDASPEAGPLPPAGAGALVGAGTAAKGLAGQNERHATPSGDATLNAEQAAQRLQMQQEYDALKTQVTQLQTQYNKLTSYATGYATRLRQAKTPKEKQLVWQDQAQAAQQAGALKVQLDAANNELKAKAAGLGKK